MNLTIRNLFNGKKNADSHKPSAFFTIEISTGYLSLMGTKLRSVAPV